jgi:hypothetical protein
VGQRTLGAVNQFVHIDLRRGEVRHGAEASAQSDSGASTALARRIELALQSGDEKARTGGIGVWREERQLCLSFLGDDVRPSGLTSHRVRKIAERCGLGIGSAYRI